MTTKQIKHIVHDLLGYSTDKWITLDEIHHISILKWENIYPDKTQRRLYFDTTNGFLNVCDCALVSEKDHPKLIPGLYETITNKDGSLSYYIYKTRSDGTLIKDTYDMEAIKIFVWKETKPLCSPHK